MNRKRCISPVSSLFPLALLLSVLFPAGAAFADGEPGCAGTSITRESSLETLRPMQHSSYTSRLIDIAMTGSHNEVKLDPVSLRQLIAWVDTNCPYRGEEDIRAIPDPEFAGIEQLPIRPKVATAPTIPRP